MSNPSKRKGDDAEREAVAVLRDLAPGLTVPKPERMLGAGRREDIGDLKVFPDVAVQVRNLKAADIGTGIRSSAVDAVTQAANGDKPYALGMVPIPRAGRSGAVRWLACLEPPHWPVPVEAVADFKQVSRLVQWARDDQGPDGYIAWPREQRIGRLHGGPTPVLVAPIEAWIAAYRTGKMAAQAHAEHTLHPIHTRDTHPALAAQSA